MIENSHSLSIRTKAVHAGEQPDPGTKAAAPNVVMSTTFITDPLLRLTDIAVVTKLAKEAGAKVAVDSTFATPIATQPIVFGVDYVLHSLTKYLGGHGDAIGGAILGSADEIASIRRTSIHTGGILSPFKIRVCYYHKLI